MDPQEQRQGAERANPFGSGGTPVSRTSGTVASPPAVQAPVANAFLLTILPALLLAVVATALCRAAAGVSLGLFFGGVLVATLLVPPLSAAEASPRRAALVPLAVSIGVSLVWLTARGDLLRSAQWLACSAVLLAYAFALYGVCLALIAIRWSPVVAAGFVTVLGLLWLTWPVWLGAALLRPSGDALAAWLVPAHPLFAVNGVLAHFDSWDRYPLAYRRLTVLNQDVFYAMPATVTWSVAVHAAVALATGAASMLLRRSRIDLSGAPTTRDTGVPPVR